MSDLKFNIDDLKFTEESDGVLVEVDENTETYQILVKLGRHEDPSRSDQEAFEAGLDIIIRNQNNFG